MRHSSSNSNHKAFIGLVFFVFFSITDIDSALLFIEVIPDTHICMLESDIAITGKGCETLCCALLSVCLRTLCLPDITDIIAHETSPTV